MSTLAHKGRVYQIGGEGFLLEPDQWDENFAEGMAPQVKIHDTLSNQHWAIIHYIRKVFVEEGRCPLIYEVCRENKLHLTDLQRLFPTGYQRGACRVAGITYRVGYLGDAWQPQGERKAAVATTPEKIYRVDVRGFLVDPDEWDEEFAVAKAFEMKVPGKLGDRHWSLIRFLRDKYKRDGTVPTVYETCEAHKLEIDDLEYMFPDGYHRGVVKIAGLRL